MNTQKSLSNQSALYGNPKNKFAVTYKNVFEIPQRLIKMIENMQNL